MVRGMVNTFITWKKKQEKKHITSLVNDNCDKITNPKDIPEEEERFLEEIYTSRNMDPNCQTFNEFFETQNALSEDIAKTCEGVMSIHECEIPGTNGLTPEFYRNFWDLLGSFITDRHR